MPTPSDPYYNNTVLHLPFDSDLRDKSLYGNAVTAFGNVAVSTTEKKHGAGSAVFDVSGDYLSMSDGGRFVFGTADFTVEAWIKTSTTSRDLVIVDYFLTGAGGWQIYITSAGMLAFYENTPNFSFVSTGQRIDDAQWHHVAASRSVGFLRLFVDGVLTLSVANSKNHINPGSPLGIGAQIGTRKAVYDFVGHIDDLRITKGIARYTENFTPPSAIEYFNWDDPANVTPSTAESYTFAPYSPPRAVHLPTIAPGPISGIRGGTEYGGRGRIVGTVKNKGEPDDTPVYRRVRLFKDRDGQCVAETWSNPVTGAYAFENINLAHKYTALSYDHTGQFRAVVADNLTPEAF